MVIRRLKNPAPLAFVGLSVLLSLLFTGCASRGQSSCATPATDTAVVDAAGTVHVTRVVPVPTTISLEAQRVLAMPVSDAAPIETLAERRSRTDAWQSKAGEVARSLYPVNIELSTIGGVPVRMITPLTVPDENRDRILINVHGGGFKVDSGSLTETIPIAN